MQAEHSHPLEIFFRHNRWSNLLLLDACMTLDEAQLGFSSGGTYGSIQATLSHIVFAEERYVFHITGGKQFADAQRAPDTSLSELRARAEKSGQALIELATTLDGGVPVRVGSGDDSFMIPIEALLLQAVHHAHEHRTQVESMLGQLGIEPPGLSGWRYFEEQIAPA